MLRSPTVATDPDEPAIVAVGDVAETRGGRSRPATGVAVLTPRELVIAAEPVEYLEGARYGVDLLAVPRERLAGLSQDGRSLTVHVAGGRTDAEGASPTLTLDPCLVEAMHRLFGPAVRWA